jgi:hypothetical protein
VNIANRRTPPTRPAGKPGSRQLRAAPRKPFLERNRGRLLWGLAGLALAATAGIAFLNATSPAYACANEWSPVPTPSPAPSATQHLGYVQTDTGREHVTTGAFVKYALCPPATGKHYNASGEGPIHAGVFGPDDAVVPQGWIHNLEHGGLVLLYRCTDGDSACSDAGQAALRQFNAGFPNSPICNLPVGSIGPVVARFDQMKTPYAALLWGLVLPLDTLDTNQIYTFFQQSGERTNPESLCTRPTPTPGPTDSPGPSASASTAPSASPTATPPPPPTASPAPGPS